MKIHHLRNATFIIEAGDLFILVDPMLGKKGTLPPLSFIRHEPKRNPTVELPGNAEAVNNEPNGPRNIGNSLIYEFY